jgi:hypothetical protein
MMPIHEPLSRIRRVERFGQAGFIPGYYDRVEDGIIRVPLHGLYTGPDDHFCI